MMALWLTLTKIGQSANLTSRALNIFFFFFLDNFYSGTAQSTRPVTAHRRICTLRVGAHLADLSVYGNT